MVPLQQYTLVFAPEVVDHLKFIEVRHHLLIRKAIEEQLRFTPTLAVRNRKILHQPAPFGATWELRVGPNNRLRVFYDVDQNEKIVEILAIGVKHGNRLIIAGKEYHS
jgi:mRNA-degrading endonuclease RelE of RelBE toxin-antitoxin system